MTTELEEDKYLTIQLLGYDNPKELTERYYFLEMSTLQATTLLPQDRKIESSEIVAYNGSNKYLDDLAKNGFKTIGDFNDFFMKNPDYHIHNCEIELKNGTTINSHDDGEVSVEFPTDNEDQLLIDVIFDKYNLDKTLIKKLNSKPGHYFAIDKQSKVTADFKSFDDYLQNGRARK